jgi:hypothetical protein
MILARPLIQSQQKAPLPMVADEEVLSQRFRSFDLRGSTDGGKTTNQHHENAAFPGWQHLRMLNVAEDSTTLALNLSG